MKIIRIDLYKVALPMRHSFVTGFGEIKSKEVVIVKLTASNGLVGYGESSTLQDPSYTSETVDTCLLIQEKFIAPKIIGKSFTSAVELCNAYGAVAGNNLAKAGVECAFWHLLAQEKRVPLAALFGGTAREVPVGEGVGIKSNIHELLQEVEERLKQGFVRIKLKIKPGWDVEPLAAVRDRWPSINLMADGNAAYRLKEHGSMLQSLDRFNLSMLEQPLPADDLVDHATLQAGLATPVCLDESIENIGDAKAAIALKSCRIINIKPGRVGGVLASMRIHDLAASHGIGVWCGGMLETGIGRAFNLALASKTNYKYPADMSPYDMYFLDDLTEPNLSLTPGGTITVPQDSGLGFTVKEAALSKYSLQHIEIT